jgi:succinylarginine dihydrolase
MLPLSQFKRLDVREVIRNGGEPFPAIRLRVDALAPDEGLIIIAPFLPSPLIEKLNSEGFASRVERGQGADWMVYFWRAAA